MSRRAVLSVLGRVLVAGLSIALVDLALHVLFSYRQWPSAPLLYSAHLIVLCTVTVLLHLGPILVLAEWLTSRLKPSAIAGAGLAVFALSWQATLMKGAGIRAEPYYWLLRVSVAIAAPVFFWTLVQSAHRNVPRKPRLLIYAIALSAILLTEYRYYRGFHVHLAIFMAVMAYYAVSLWGPPSWVTRAAGAGTLLAMVGALASWPRRVPIEGQILRSSYATAPLMLKLPVSHAWLTPLSLVVDPYASLSTAERQKRSPLVRTVPAREKKADNVVLLILEAVRWEYWADPIVAPEFAEMRRNGTYFPRAVAAYPATPLAYGAIFTSQPASVLLATGQWKTMRPFDILRPQFRELALTQPAVTWFEDSTLTGFFVPPDVPVAAHDSSKAALDSVRRRIETASERPFFAWAHLFEPHHPFESHPEFGFGDDFRSRYKSEVAYVDRELGRFLRWFEKRPEMKTTLLVVVADHGEGLGDPGGDGPIYYHSFHVENTLTAVPLYVQGPGLPRGRVELELGVSQLDVLPTMFDALGEALSGEYAAQGRSLYRLLEERPVRSLVSEQLNLDGTAFYELVQDTTKLSPQERMDRFAVLSKDPAYASKIALFHGNLKLIYDRVLRREWLFDVLADPFEKSNLAMSRPAELRLMRGRLESWLLTQSWVIERAQTRARLGSGAAVLSP